MSIKIVGIDRKSERRRHDESSVGECSESCASVSGPLDGATAGCRCVDRVAVEDRHCGVAGNPTGSKTQSARAGGEWVRGNRTGNCRRCSDGRAGCWIGSYVDYWASAQNGSSNVVSGQHLCLQVVVGQVDDNFSTDWNWNCRDEVEAEHSSSECSRFQVCSG